MYKKRRINQESQESLRLSQSSNTKILGVETKDANGVDKKHYKSLTFHNTKPTPFTHKQLANLLCPPYQVNRLWYGNTFHTFTAGAFSTTSAFRKSEFSSGTQDYQSFIHMPARMTNAATYSLDQLIDKAKDVSNYKMITTQGNDPLSGADRNDCTINYYGGKVKHTFTNTCNIPLTFELTVCTPRQFLSWQSTTSATATYDNHPAQTALLDFSQNVPFLNVIEPQNSASAIDSSTDVMFRLGSSCRTLHYKWKVSKPTRCILQPGQQLDFVVNIPAFKFTNSDWNTYLTSYTSGAVQIAALPEFLPFCTVLLEVRVKSHLVHNANYSQVQYGDGAYTHVQQEYHNLQACPYVKLNNIVTINSLDEAIAAADQLVINPLTEAEMKYED